MKHQDEITMKKNEEIENLKAKIYSLESKIALHEQLSFLK
jgi:hypothetical protein